MVATGLVGYHLNRTPELVSAPEMSTSATVTTPQTTPRPTPTEHSGWLPGDSPPRQTKTVAAPPKTVTVQAPAPAPPPVYEPTVDMAAFDGQFIRNMLAQGWQIWNPDQSADTARLACSMLTNGATFDYVANFLATKSQASIEEGRIFTSTAMRTYPQCP
jgi:hypothetical protein